jgi:hypothetical protein
MSTSKKIQINPDLFKLSEKTRRKRDPNVKITPSPTISSNKLKNKLLSRIKDHKSEELKQLSNKNGISSDSTNDDFNDAIHYLNDLKKKKINEIVKEKHHKKLNNTTIKNYNTPTIQQDSVILPTKTVPYVEIDLPIELQEPSFHINTSTSTNTTTSMLQRPIHTPTIVPTNNNGYNFNYAADKDIPYGCLKNGLKPSYRTFTRKNPETYSQLTIQPPLPPPSVTMNITELSRQQRLDNIKNKLKQIQEQEQIQKSIIDLPPLDDTIKTPTLDVPINLNRELSFENTPTNKVEPSHLPVTATNSSKTFIKKTIKRKFTLGKKDGRVSVLIKDNQTRKNLMKAHNEIKKTDISDVRKHLRNNGLIKVGSTAPNDILRKTFESAMLSGNVINTNAENKLYNFTHGTDTETTSST